MIEIFDCDAEEARAFEEGARRRGADVSVTGAAITVERAARVPCGAAVSVSHRNRIDREILERLRARGVVYMNTRSVGTNHIDMARAQALGITVQNVCYCPESVAEHTVMLMLMALRDAARGLRRVENRDYRLPPSRCETLFGMTVGIVGTGRIGQCVARRLAGFGCHIVGCDPHPCAGVAVLSLDELLRQSDIVSLHLPLTPNTRHLIDRRALSQMKRGAYLVNAARGALVDSRALAEALEEGRLAGAALDVVEGEEDWFYRDCSREGEAPFSRLCGLPNLLLTPHSAFYTRRALEDIVQNTLENCMKFEEERRAWIG